MKILLIRKGHVLTFGGILMAVAIFWAVNMPAVVETSVAARQLPIYCVERSDNVIAISFDAAWGEVILRQI